MTIERQALTRTFLYAGMTMQDPDPALSPIEVRDLFSVAGRPELATAEVRGPELVGGTLEFTFHRAVGTKGLKGPEPESKELHKRVLVATMEKALGPFQKKRVEPLHANTSKALQSLFSSSQRSPYISYSRRDVEEADAAEFIQPPASLTRWCF